jgi:hypothetical protein
MLKGIDYRGQIESSHSVMIKNLKIKGSGIKSKIIEGLSLYLVFYNFILDN